MIEEGLLEEVKGLQLFKSQKNLQTVGYAELFDFLDGKYSLDEAVEKIKQHTRNYAKRQLTWFRKDKDYHWLEANDPLVVEKILALKP
jgi:tRNA dimethylallyltransferase